MLAVSGRHFSSQTLSPGNTVLSRHIFSAPSVTLKLEPPTTPGRTRGACLGLNACSGLARMAERGNSPSYQWAPVRLLIASVETVSFPRIFQWTCGLVKVLQSHRQAYFFYFFYLFFNSLCLLILLCLSFCRFASHWFDWSRPAQSHTPRPRVARPLIR